MVIRFRLAVAVVALSVFFAGVEAQAAPFIVNTGTPDEAGPAWIVSGPGGFTQQSLAFEFSTSQSVVVTGLQGYFWDNPIFATPGTLTVALYRGSSLGSNGGVIPDTANEVFSRQFQIDGVDHENDFLFGGWHGIQDLAVLLSAGTYWIAFEGRGEADTYVGAMPGSSPNPLTTAAFTYEGVYSDSLEPVDSGVRIEVTPEPTSLWLITTGILGFAAAGWKRRLSF